MREWVWASQIKETTSWMVYKGHSTSHSLLSLVDGKTKPCTAIGKLDPKVDQDVSQPGFQLEIRPLLEVQREIEGVSDAAPKTGKVKVPQGEMEKTPLKREGFLSRIGPMMPTVLPSHPPANASGTGSLKPDLVGTVKGTHRETKANGWPQIHPHHALLFCRTVDARHV